MPIKILLFTLFSLFIASCSQQSGAYFEEKNGVLIVEAENFHRQEKDDIRKWYRIDQTYTDSILPDGDEVHFATASQSAYLEILPDTRRNHQDKLIAGENFSNKPGQLAILHYQVKINTPGKYYVWVRAYSTGSEDNGIHVGLDGEWVDSGQRMQWCEGKQQWAWASKQRTKEVHCGVERQIFLDIPEAGMHTISFSMREDGFEFDKWILTQTYDTEMGFGATEFRVLHQP